MRLKLEPAKKILEGIALADFQTIKANSEQLRKLSLDEGWMVLQTEAYHQQSQDFKKSLDLISRMCEEKDLDGVALAYMQMTMRCVQCHKMLRDSRKP
jgi:cytochrome c556